MTNEGVRQYIIQCYLRHDDPNMMQAYAKVLPETEKKEINQLHKQKKIVDITGQEVSINHPELDDNIGLQWLRSKMQPKALAMGFCARPQLLKPCPHANACYTCPSFIARRELLPDYIKVRDLLRDKQTRAEEKGETALIDQFKQQADSLDTVIASFERVA